MLPETLASRVLMLPGLREGAEAIAGEWATCEDMVARRVIAADEDAETGGMEELAETATPCRAWYCSKPAEFYRCKQNVQYL